MQRIKLLAIGLFLLPLLIFYSKFVPSSVVSSQSGNLFAPTGVIASDSKYNNKVRLDWDAVRGAINYRIYRNTANDTATAIEVGATPANSFLDFSAVA